MHNAQYQRFATVYAEGKQSAFLTLDSHGAKWTRQFAAQKMRACHKLGTKQIGPLVWAYWRGYCDALQIAKGWRKTEAV